MHVSRIKKSPAEHGGLIILVVVNVNVFIVGYVNLAA